MIELMQAGENGLGNKPIILIIDFANVAYSGWYSKPEINHNGYNVNAILVFFSRLRTLKQTFDPTYLVIAEDMGRNNTFRRKMFAQYKAQRKPLDPDIGQQMAIIQSLDQSLGFARIYSEPFEADDIVGMVSKWGDDNGFDSVIISSDRDMYQLISPNTYVMSPKDNTIIDLEYMKEIYNLTPEQWIELKILQGDGADNIPGIRGIGKKSALELMQQFGSLENIYANLHLLRPHTRDLLIAGKDDIPLMRDLVTIITDYSKINLTESKLQRHELRYDIIDDVMEKYGLMTSLGNIMTYGMFPQPYEKLEVFTNDASETNQG